jgi:hypothetical protein
MQFISLRPPEMHAEHVLIAAKCGKHVIVEKPMTLTIDDADRMNKTADKYKIKLLCVHTHSFDAPVRKMREIAKRAETTAADLTDCGLRGCKLRQISPTENYIRVFEFIMPNSCAAPARQERGMGYLELACANRRCKPLEIHVPVQLELSARQGRSTARSLHVRNDA